MNRRSMLGGLFATGVAATGMKAVAEKKPHPVTVSNKSSLVPKNSPETLFGLKTYMGLTYPSAPQIGQLVKDNDTMKYWDGSSWTGIDGKS